MRKTLIAIAALMIAGPALAEGLAKDTQLGKTPEEITTTLVKMGYQVRKTDMEDGKIEAYAVKDGKMLEVYVDAGTGAVTEIKTN